MIRNLFKSNRLSIKLLGPLFLVVIVAFLGAGITIYLSYKMQMALAPVLALIVVLLIFFISVILVFTGFYVFKQVITPLDILKKGVSQLAQGNFETPIRVSTGDEIEELAQEFNLMSAALFESQQSLADAARENAELYQEEQRRSQELALINRLNNTVLASLDVETTLDAVLRHMKPLLDYTTAEINLWDVDTNILKAYAVGDTGYTASVGNYYTLEEGFTGWIATRRETLFIPNVKHFATAKPKGSLKTYPFQAFIGLPLMVGENFLGTIELAHTGANYYTPADVQTLTLLAGQAAVAIRHAQLFQETQERALAQEQLAQIAVQTGATLNLDELLEQGMSKTVQALQATKCAVLLLNDDKTELYPHPAGTVGMSSDVAEVFGIATTSPQFEQTVFSTKRPFWSHSAATDKRILPLYHAFIQEQNITTVLVVPLTTAEETIGEIYILNKPASFTLQDVTFLTSVASQLATAIQNIRLFEATQRNLNELSVLYNSAADLSATLSVNDVLDNLSQQMETILPADACRIVKYNEEADQLEPFIPDANPEELAPVLSLGHAPFIATALQQHKPTGINPDTADDCPEVQTFLKTSGYTCLFALPLVARNKSLGLIAFLSFQPKTYPIKDVNLAQVVANQAAIALQNAQLYKETDQQLKLRLSELRGLQKVNKELNSTLVLDNILRKVVEEAVRATSAGIGNVTLYDSDKRIFTTHVHVGWPEDAPDMLTTLTSASGVIGRVIDSVTPEIVADTRNDPDYIPFPIPSRSQMVVPIQSSGVIEGVINLEGNVPDVFTPAQLSYVQALADQAAIAIRNAQAYAEQVKERGEAGARVTQLAKLSEINRAFRANQPLAYILEEIAFAIQESVGFNLVLLSIVEQGELYRITGAGIPLVELNEIRQKHQALEALEAMLQPKFKLSASYFIPTEERRIWEDKYDIIVLESVLGHPAKDNPYAWQKEDLLLTPLNDAEGRIIGLLSVDAPINGRRPDIQTITTLELFANQAATVIENSNLFEELQRHATHLKLSSQLSARISSILNPTELIGEVVNLIAQTFNYYHVQIYQPDELHPGRLVFQSGAGVANVNYKEIPPHRHLPLDDSCIIGWVANHQQPLLINDVSADARFFAAPHLPDTRSEMAIPITVAGNLAGVLDIQHNQLDTFSREALENLQTLTDQFAVAVQNARLFDDALQREQLSSALGSAGLTLNATLDLDAIIDVICEEAVSTFKVDAAFLWLTEDHLAKGVAGAGLYNPDFIGQTIPVDDESAFSAKIIRQRRAQFINYVNQPLSDAPTPASYSLQAVIGVPLVVRDSILGVLLLLDYQTPNRFDIQDRISVTLFTNQAAISLENARLIDRLNRFTEDLEQRVDRRTEELRLERDRVDTLYKLARGLSSSLDLDRILNEALGLLSQSIPITQGAILLVDDATGTLIYRAALGRVRGLPRGGQPTRYRTGVGLAGKILEAREPLLEGNLPANKDWLPDGKPLRHHSMLGVPLITGYEVVGVLMLFHTEPDYFSSDHLRLVKAAAPIIATAINNAGLYNLISDQVERLGVLLSTVRAEARKNEAIIKGIADGVLVLDENHTIQLVNPAAATILGRTQGQLQNSKLAYLVAKSPETIEERFTYELEHIIAAGQSVEGETPSVEDVPQPTPHRVEIENKVILVILSTVTLSPNAPVSTLVVLRDISREAELDRIKNEFISTVSHELRTPMTSIKGYTDLLATDKVGQLTDMQRKFVQVIKNNADRLTALVNDILDISRIDTGRVRLDLQHTLVPTLITSVITSLSTQIQDKELSLTLNVPENLPAVFADANRVTQILVNLVSNAVKYTRPHDGITVTATASEKYVQIDVADTGLGIAANDLAQVFNRFFRAERDDVSLVGGTGLGLPIAKMFIEMMSGEIWVDSVLNEGTTFSFTLPLEDQRLEETEVVAAISKRRRILAVDDNIDILNLLKRNLEQEGYSVLTTLRGQRVLDMAKKYQPSLITLDIMLNDADGFDILEQLKADPQTKDIPVVIASVLADAQQRGMALGAAGYIVKPFDLAQVLDTVSRLADTLQIENTALAVNNILVVDDDKDIVNWLMKELADNGFSVTGAYNGAEALHLAQAAVPDLILLDMKMPGMDGFMVIEKLRSNPATAKIPVIVITGSSIDSHSDTIKMLGLGASNLITKPFSLSDLVSEIKRLETPAGQPII